MWYLEYTTSLDDFDISEKYLEPDEYFWFEDEIEDEDIDFMDY